MGLLPEIEWHLVTKLNLKRKEYQGIGCIQDYLCCSSDDEQTYTSTSTRKLGSTNSLHQVGCSQRQTRGIKALLMTISQGQILNATTRVSCLFTLANMNYTVDHELHWTLFSFQNYKTLWWLAHSSCVFQLDIPSYWNIFVQNQIVIFVPACPLFGWLTKHGCPPDFVAVCFGRDCPQVSQAIWVGFCGGSPHSWPVLKGSRVSCPRVSAKTISINCRVSYTLLNPCCSLDRIWAGRKACEGKKII